MQKDKPSSSANNSSRPACKYLCPLEQLSGRLEQVGQFEDNPRLAIACSGGGDSLALLLLCKEWWLAKYGNSSAKKSNHLANKKAEKFCEHNIVALICDHGIRAESASECQELKEVIEKQFELSAHILTAQSFANQRGNLQENMRHFRIKACQEWCRANAVIHLLFGHTQDDQVETYLLQQTNQLRGSGAMQQLRYARHARIIRPMLEIRRLDLRKWLSRRNISWLEDPSNQSSNYARNRLRRELKIADKSYEKKGCEKSSTRSILDACEQIRATSSAIDRELENFTAQYVTLYPEGYARIETREFLKLHALAAQRLVSSLAQRVGGGHVRSAQVKQTLPLWREKMESFLAKRPPSDETNLVAPNLVTPNLVASSPVVPRERRENKPPTLSLGRTLLLANRDKRIDRTVYKTTGDNTIEGQIPIPYDFLIVRARVAPEELDITLREETESAGVWMQSPLWDGRYRILPPLESREERPRQISSQLLPSPQPLNLTCRLLGRIGIEQLRKAAKNKTSQKDASVVQALRLFESLHARVREVCPAFWRDDQLCALPTLKIYRNFPSPETFVRGAGEQECWLSTKEGARFPRIRWETIWQQNIEKNAIFNF